MKRFNINYAVHEDGAGTTHNIVNYSGLLFSKTNAETPFLNMIGGRRARTASVEFVTNSNYELADAAQPAITEKQSMDGQTPSFTTRDQHTNIVQIFQKSVKLSYLKQSANGQLAGINVAGQSNNVPSELDFQIGIKMTEMQRDVETSFINGVFQKNTNDDTAAKTRGIIEAIETNKLANVNDTVSRDMINQLLYTMRTNNAYLGRDTVLLMNSRTKMAVSDAFYANQPLPQSRNVAGIDITDIVTDFGTFMTAIDDFVPAGTIIAVHMPSCRVVEMETRGKGNFFYEPKQFTGAAEGGMLYGLAGLDYGAEFNHGIITGITFMNTLGDITVSAAQVSGNATTLTLPANASGYEYVYKAGAKEQDVYFNQDLSVGGWKPVKANKITGVSAGQVVTVARVLGSTMRAKAVGKVTLS